MLSRLSDFRVEGLFGLYDHRIALNLDDRITIIIGPNGRGKTVCLKIIEALFRDRYGYIADIPFSVATFNFTGGEVVTLVRTVDADSRSLNFALHRPNKESIYWAPAMVDARLAREIRRHIPRQWEQVGTDLWVDETDGEELTFRELARRYPIPTKLAAALEQTTPDEFRALIGAIDCHLIETQRLLVLQAGGGDSSDEFNEYIPHAFCSENVVLAFHCTR
jgi:energy-coupling factor transporter ATP-binding protein EcfA2